MSTRRRYLGWGVFLICVGIVPLAYQAGLIDIAGLGQVVRLWPLIVIAIGMGIALRASRYRGLAGVLVAGVLGLLVGASLAGGVSTIGGCTGSQSSDGTPFNDSGDASSGAPNEPLRVNVDVSCASFTASSAGTSNWTVSGTADQAPLVTADPGHIDLQSAGTSRIPFVSRGETWNAQLPAQIALAYFKFNASSATLNLGPGEIDMFSLDLNAGDADVDLSKVDLSHGPINATLNAASAKVVLPSSGTGATGTVHVNAASLDLCANPSLALSVRYDGTLSSDNFAAAGLSKNGDTWTTAGYSTAAAHVDLNLNANVSTVNIDRSGECQ
jgi:hypothetical protein